MGFVFVRSEPQICSRRLAAFPEWPGWSRSYLTGHRWHSEFGPKQPTTGTTSSPSSGSPARAVASCVATAPSSATVLGLLSLAVHANVPVATMRTMIYAYPTFHRGIDDAVNELELD